MDYIKTGVESVTDWLKSFLQRLLQPVVDFFSPLFTKSTARTLIITLLVTFISSVLFLFACVGYLAFYHEYLPDQVMTVPVHLQYGYELNPYGVASLAHANFKDYQDYDISVTLNLPNSPSNLARGNFMLALYLLDSPHAPSSIKITRPAAPPTAASYAIPMPTTVPAPQSVLNNKNILFTSTRPAIMPYTDPLVSLAKRLLLLAYHVFVPCSETTKLTVPMAERLLFIPGKMMPGALVLDIQAGQSLQVYDVLVTLTAQLGGLRWFMHTWWVTSFVLFTALFWVSEVFFLAMTAVVIKILFGVLLGGGGGTGIKGPTPPSRMKLEGEGDVRNNNDPRIKREGGGGKAAALEDVPMTFPTSSQQPPLRYDPEPGGHASGVDEGGGGGQAQGDVGGEADVEEDEEDYRFRYQLEDEEELRARDSGIGTSFSERDGAGGGSVRRRSSLRRMGGGN